jgi:hypothetical protein
VQCLVDWRRLMTQSGHPPPFIQVVLAFGDARVWADATQSATRCSAQPMRINPNFTRIGACEIPPNVARLQPRVRQIDVRLRRSVVRSNQRRRGSHMRTRQRLVQALVAACLSLAASAEARATEYAFSTYALGESAFAAGVAPWHLCNRRVWLLFWGDREGRRVRPRGHQRRSKGRILHKRSQRTLRSR